MFEAHLVAVCFCGAVAPARTQGDRLPGSVADFVVGDLVVAGLTDPHATHRAGVYLSCAVNEVVRDHVVVGLGVLGGRIAALAEPHRAAAHVVDVVSHNAVVLRAAAQPDAIGAEVRELATVDVAVATPLPWIVAGTLTAACMSQCPPASSRQAP